MDDTLRVATRNVRTPAVVAVVFALVAAFGPGASGLDAQGSTSDRGTRLLRQPTVSDSSIAFRYGGDLWIVSRDGGQARRLTSHEGTESHPHFSPDGTEVAFSARFGGGHDVYVIAAGGGEPRRLTWHAGADAVEGWTPDGEAVLFTSSRRSPVSDHRRLFTVPRTGGLPRPLAVPRAQQGELSSNGARLAYQPVDEGDRQWRAYRGGKARPVWLFDRKDHSVTKLPRAGRSRQIEPVWLGDTVYLLSDRTGILNVWAYDEDDHRLRQVTDHQDFDVMNLDAGGGVVVYQQAGWLHLFDPTTGDSRQLRIEVEGDFPRAQPRRERAAAHIERGRLSPDGTRVLFEARGDLFTVGIDTSTWRNLIRSSGAADRTPAWSPDGGKIAWLSDREGEYALMVGPTNGEGTPERYALEDPTFFYDLQWGPNSRRVLFTDAERRLWWLDTETGEQGLVDQDPHTSASRSLDPTWSPDGRWIAYAKRLDNRFRAIMVYSLDRDTAYRVTHGRADATSPAWDPGGAHLYFAASTDYSVHTGWLDMSTFHRPLTRGLYVTVLREGGGLPGDTESSDDSASHARAASPRTGPVVRIDTDGLSQRIVPLELSKARYDRLRTGREPGVLFYLERRTAYTPLAYLSGSVQRYDVRAEEESTVLTEADSYSLDASGEHLLYRAGDSWGVVPADGEAEAGQESLSTDSLRIRVDPREEWRQIFEESWRIKRDYFYVENMHGADWEAVREAYRPWIEHVRSRADLNYVLDLMAGELAVSHANEAGGDQPEIDAPAVGELGVDLEVSEGRYRIRRIYRGAPWTPGVPSPLAKPGLEVSEGDYLLAVNGEQVLPPENPYRTLEGTAGREITLRVNDQPTRHGSRQITVTPVESGDELRLWSWVEANRRRVDSLSDGKLAYVYVPNTALDGYRFFNRLFFNQQDREGVIIDGRFNGGGFSPEYMIEIMTRPLMGFNSNPTSPGKPRTEPGSGLWGPRVLVVNEEAGSGGDFLAYFFKLQDLGPLVGRRTAGAEVGAYDYPTFVDGGSASVPRSGFYDREGAWAIENEGVVPDIRVEQTPRDVIGGADPQLDRAVEEALRLLREEEWPVTPPQPRAPETADVPPKR